MALVQSPSVVTNGLVFYYDQNNIKSLAGPPIQNLAFTRVVQPTSATGISISGGYETVDVPQVGQTNAAFANIQNNYTSFSPNSADCCPSPISYTNPGPYGFTVSPSTLYTYAIVYKVNSGYTNANYMYRYEYTASGGSYVTEGGVHSDSNRIHLGDGWYWAWGTFTTQATTNWIGFHGAFYYRYSNTTDKLSIAKVLIVRGDYTALHPKYWPEDNTTRSSTQVLRDLTNRNTITATSLTYASDGSFSFNGASSEVTASANASSLGISNDLTISVFTRRFPTSSPADQQGILAFGNGEAISFKNTDYYFVDIFSATPTQYIVPFTPGGGIGPYNNVWMNMCVTVSGTTVKTYLNGSLVTTQVMNTNIKSFSSNAFGIGAGYGYYRLNGNVSAASVYNRALTAAEVQQNFNALRGRYGI